jgi:hypothetical protein
MKSLKLVLFISLLFFKFDQTSATNDTFSHFIGEYFQGGIIFHLWIGEDRKEHGLIVSTINLDTNAIWINDCEDLGGFGSRSTGDFSKDKKKYYNYILKDGALNTKMIINQKGHKQSAAKTCVEYSHDGYSDWYLPSLLELNLLLNNFGVVNYSLEKNIKYDKLSEAMYMSSTECWKCDYLGVNLKRHHGVFSTNIVSESFNKSESYANSFVRAIRKF